MKKFFSNLSAEKKLAMFTFVLGVIAIFAGDPYGKTSIKINAKELSLISPNEIGKIKVEDIADNIIQSKSDYRLIDLRKPEEFAKYNIPTSENIQLDKLLNSELQRNEKLILYSDNDIEATQAWFLLKTNNFKGINIIPGGLNNWKDNILFPKCDCGENPSAEQKHKHDKLAEVSKYFGGNIQTNSAAESFVKNEMPQLAAPNGITLKKTSGKKKREGC
ncbi:MAG: rhodanese-like domain-containing protein [Ignavibacteriae bacterium]|nr:rhodanese-like domain-containing protein [Ignavibacteriota bacterium]